jgi:hypothetical protein
MRRERDQKAVTKRISPPIGGENDDEDQDFTEEEKGFHTA